VQILDAPHATAIHLHIDGQPGSITNEVRDDPERLVLQLSGVVNATGKSQIPLGSPRADRVDIEATPNGALRLVVTPGAALDPFHNYGVSPTDEGVLLTVGAGELVLRPDAAEVTRAPEPPPEEPAPAPRRPARERPAPDEMTVPVIPAPPPGAEREPETEAAEQIEPAEPWRDDVPEAAASETGREPVRADGLVYPVSDVQIQYARVAVGQPLLTDLAGIDAQLLRTSQGWVAPRQGIESTTVRVTRPPGTPVAPFYGSAIRAMNQAVVNEFNRRGLVGVLVRPHPDDIDPNSSRDLREKGDTTLRLVVWTGRLIESRTFASGDRIPEEARTDNPAHQRIKDGSPIKPGEVLNKDELDDYIAFLNRQPGRTVDATLTKSLEPGGVYLDYLVAENKPWTVYAQASNTGTKETSRWRERFGFVDNQLTGRDDILRLDYVTGDFSDVHAVFGSYETPLGFLERHLRLRTGGSWSEFDASEVGIQNADFKGNQWSAGSQAIVNVFQYGDLFVDLFAGGRYQHVENKSEPIPNFIQKGRVNFFFAETGLRLERRTESSNILVSVGGDFNVPTIAGTEVGDLDQEQLGRSDINDKNIEILRWDALASFYLDPVFQSSESSDAMESSPLAHEIFLRTRGQSTTDRLIPYQQAIAGGLHTVRGYEQSLLAADEAAFYRGEYRLHVPRLFPVQPVPLRIPGIGDFRVAPQHSFGRPDWDLILRAFVDGAYLQNNDAPAGEFRNEHMLSVGGGVELQLLSNFVARVDYGYALERAGDDDYGHDETHLSFTILY
jgi:hypothetical protein